MASRIHETARIGQLLFVASQAAQALASERLEPLGLTPRAWGVLSTLSEAGPLSQIDLARALTIDRTAMVYLLDELEDAGLVERVRNPRDRRSFLIHPTPAGSRLRQQAARALEGQAAKLLAPLTRTEQRQLVVLLGKVAAHRQRAL